MRKIYLINIFSRYFNFGFLGRLVHGHMQREGVIGGQNPLKGQKKFLN